MRLHIPVNFLLLGKAHINQYVCMSCPGLSGMAMDLRGSGVACVAIDGNGKHDLIIDSISRSIPGNHTFSRTICFVRTTP